MKEFNTQICTSIEQSQRLLALGLNPETADMCWFNDMQKPFCASYKRFVDRAQDMKWVIFPAWSLHRLLLLCDVTAMFARDILETAYDDQINAIENLIKNGYFNKEYLKQ